MKAPSFSDDEGEGGADQEQEQEKDIVFDYSDFFSVLMYYGHMSKEEIMNHSRAFLHGIYQTYYSRVKENLDVAYFSSGKNDEDEDSTDESVENIYAKQCELSSSDYPKSFTKLQPKSMMMPESTPESTKDFLSSFGDSVSVFKDVQITDE